MKTTVMLLLISVLWITGCSLFDGGGSGPSISPNIKDHVYAAHAYARDVIQQVTGGRVRDRIVGHVWKESNKKINGVWCIPYPSGVVGVPPPPPQPGMSDERPPKSPEFATALINQIQWAQAYNTGTQIVQAAPPGLVWSAREWDHALNICTHEAAHTYLKRHDPAYDAFFPFWKMSRDSWGE